MRQEIVNNQAASKKLPDNGRSSVSQPKRGGFYKRCLVCGKQLQRGQLKYCSGICQRYIARLNAHCKPKKEIAITCETCGKNKIIPIWQYKHSKHHYCSKRCKYSAGRIFIKCAICEKGKEIQVNQDHHKYHYCSRECRIKGHTKYMKQRPSHFKKYIEQQKKIKTLRQIKCKECGTIKEVRDKESVVNQKYCSLECWHAASKRITGENHPTYKKEKHFKLICKYCGIEYEVPLKRKFISKYHSRKCYAKAQRKTDEEKRKTKRKRENERYYEQHEKMRRKSLIKRFAPIGMRHLIPKELIDLKLLQMEARRVLRNQFKEAR